MNTGLWLWPSDAKAQGRALREVASSPHLVQAMTLLMKSQEGLSNSELTDLTADNSNWMTLWTVRQLTSLGFVEFRVDFFGGPARYRLTELGRDVIGKITGQPAARQSPPA
jgi:hypothetical protein